ncbi:hypothetical protein PRIPAC_74416 [Pristionchus pacificus]|uniref:Uncharacterized protein n=1 Tax=Pristionchus pacificus TaxID=54126 RepID=A0A2A6BFJ1_PRIPA|nr:hypothetical protein PRIPAC_74416 [Pristionchus pacificus]|eukprot:PDM64685.1 hypothetical protein PRIPAC_52941 [Pristionchus pacificus]
MSYTGWNWTQIEQCLGRSEFKLSDRLFVGLPFLIFSKISVALNVIFMRIIHANRSTLDANLKRHVYSLAIACTGYMSVNFWSHIPIVLFAADIRDPLNIILATPNSMLPRTLFLLIWSLSVTVDATAPCDLSLITGVKPDQKSRETLK